MVLSIALDPQFRRHGARLELDLDEDAPAVSADPHRLHQLLDQLLRRAAARAAHGTVVVRLTADPHTARLSLAHGERRPPTPPEARGVRPTDLLLASIQNVLRSMNGDLEVDPSGNELTLSFPIVQPT